MTAAIFGLIGVVIGALITGGTNYVLQVRAERREIRAAARLMLQELANTGSAIRYALKLNDREFLRGATHEDEWHRHHMLLARHLSDEEWDAVALGYGEGATAHTLLDGLQADQWQPEAEEILKERGRRMPGLAHARTQEGFGRCAGDPGCYGVTSTAAIRSAASSSDCGSRCA